MSQNASASRIPLYLTYALMAFGWCSINVARVGFSLYALVLGASPTVVGLLFASFYALPVVISVPIGRYSDRMGSRGLILMAAAVATVAMLIPFFVGTIWSLFIGGLLSGISFTVYNVILPNLLGLLSAPAERVRNFSNSSLVGGLTMVAGPLAAGVAIDLVGHAWALLYLNALSVVVGALTLSYGHALPGGRSARAPADSDFASLVKDRDLLRSLGTSSLVQVGQDLWQFYIPVQGYALGLSASAIGGILSTYAAASFVVRLVMPNLVKRFGDLRVLRWSFYFAAAGFLLVPYFENPFALAAVSFLFGLGIGCGAPITTLLVFNRSPEGRSGETFGLRQTVNNVLRVSTPPAFGLVATAFGLAPVFWLSALMMGGGGLLARPR